MKVLSWNGIEDEDPANIAAAELMGNLHDALAEDGYQGRELEQFLIRILFCLFAEDSLIFPPRSFASFLENRTSEDGSDLGPQLARWFEVLNTPEEERQKTLDQELAELPYVNGRLFEGKLAFAEFNREMRARLLECLHFEWERISPAVFGSVLQSVMQPAERRQMGGHYTSERDIMRAVRSLFLDELEAELERKKGNSAELRRMHKKLGSLRLFDPACGCGNFLVIAYRELRRLETELLVALSQGRQKLELRQVTRVKVDQMYGIEVLEFPARIAQVALWLVDHQMNRALRRAVGDGVRNLPLRCVPNIISGNALRLDWREVLPPEQCSYILGNPPFVGAKLQSPDQREDMKMVAGEIAGSGLLDYATGWYFKAAKYIQSTRVQVAFVSTSSITQGEQVGILWNRLFGQHGIKIYFAHRPFSWESEARGKAQVQVVIIGFGAFDRSKKTIFDYEDDGGKATVVFAKNISPYLVEGRDFAIANRSKPLTLAPEMGIGNKPIDGGHYLFTPSEKDAFLSAEPGAEPLFRPWLGSDEFINGRERWCLWLGECPPEELSRMPEAMKRVEAVRKFRLASRSPATRKLAEDPTRFHVENIPRQPYLLIPEVSSERRRYIPMGFIPSSILASNLVKIAPDAKLYHFGVLSSAMHMAWVRQVCGRLESRYRYSIKLVYNNFPWPEAPTEAQVHVVESAAQAVLDARSLHPSATLADLYDPESMPRELSAAHAALDSAVERAYRVQPFATDRQRVEYLFDRYDVLTRAHELVAG